MERVNILKTDYEKNGVLSKPENVILEPKRAILNEQLDRIANITLSEVNLSRRNIDNYLKQCKDSLNWQKEEFWQELPPNPKYPMISINELKSNNSHEVLINQPVDLIIDNLVHINKNKITNFKDEKEDYLTKKYFFRWKQLVKLKKEKNILLEKKLEQKEKLENFVKKIKKIKKQEKNNAKSEIGNNLGNNRFPLQENPPPSPHVYKNRYKAQKNIISMQKAKLEEQNKLIEELKMGIIREDLLKSIENTKSNIREIFSNCSSNVKCKVPVIIIEETQQFKISTQKAPKVVQQLEQRAIQRAQRRQIILERKRLMEEARQKLLEEAIENKRVMEEEERKKNLEVIKERRKKELEQEKIRQANKQKYLGSLNKAINFHNKLIITQCFKRLYGNFKQNKDNVLLAKAHYKRKILKRSICSWCDYVDDTYKVKYEIADAHSAYTILKKFLKMWWDDHIENVRNRQVAEDLYDFHLTSNSFIYWHRYVCSRITIREKQLKIAGNHYKRRLLFHYFFLWRSLPAVIQLEKAKELKKRKWREKVWEIIPDYKPPEDI